jgi:hypothetical protein
MSIGPIRSPDLAGTHNVAAQQVEEAPAADLRIRPQNSSLGPTGWLPHHASAHGQAARWVAAHHSAVPSVTIGVRAGGLVPPNGTLVGHDRHAAGLAGPGGKPGAHVKAKAGKSFEDAEIDHLAAGDEAVSQGTIDALDAAVSGKDGTGDNAHSGSGRDEAWQRVEGRLRALDAAARADEAQDELGLRGTTAGDLQTDPAVLAQRLQQGEVCWVRNLRLAMQCAQMHPGCDVFVQAFLAADEDGNVLPMSSKMARLRARPNGSVLVHEGLQPMSSAPAQAGGDPALLEELQRAPLLGMALRPLVDESGRAISLLDVAGRCELDQLGHLFERPMPPAIRAALIAESERLCRRWDSLKQHADFGERMARHGDALQRLFDGRRAALSDTIRGYDASASRAATNWQRAQLAVARWAESERDIDFDSLLAINAMLGEGLHPWHRPDLAQQVGARYGVLRHFDVVCGVPPQHYLRADQLARATCDLFDWYAAAQRRLPVVLLAAQLQQRLVTLHPFADANGRTARLAADWVLLRAGLPVALQEALQMALFPNEATARNPVPGAAETTVLDGLRRSVDLYQEWLQIEALES